MDGLAAELDFVTGRVMNPLEKVPGAKQWLDGVMDNPRPYYLFDEEPFKDIIGGIFASTALDSHGEQATREALVGLAERLRESPVWMHSNHDLTIHPIGRILAAQVFDGVDGIAYLVGVSGYFDHNALPTTEQLQPLPSDPPETFWDLPDGEPPPRQAVFRLSHAEITGEQVGILLRDAPAIVSPRPSPIIRKSADAHVIIEVAVAAWLLLANPFSSAFLKRLGERSADAVVDFYRWLGREFLRNVKEAVPSGATILFSTEHNGVAFQFLHRQHADLESLSASVESLSAAVRQALVLSEKADSFQPVRVTYLYQPDAGWSLEYMVTKRFGVIARQPQFIDHARFSGLSISAAVEYEPVIDNEQEKSSDEEA